MLLSIGVVVMCVGLAAGVIGVVLPRIGSATPLAGFLRLAAVAGATAVGAGTMYVVRFNGGGPMSQVIADTAMVLAPTLMCIAVASPSARRLRGMVLLAAFLATGVAVGSTLLPVDGDVVVRSTALTLVCGLCAALAVRNRALPPGSRRMLVATMAAYAVYSAGRAVSAITGGASPLGQALYSPSAVVVAAVAAMLFSGVSVALVGRPDTVGTYADHRARTAVVIGDWKLATAAYGSDRVLALLIDLRLAARTLDPASVDAVHGVEISHPSAIVALSRRMRDVHGWRPDEIALLTTVGPRSTRRGDRDLPPSAERPCDT